MFSRCTAQEVLLNLSLSPCYGIDQTCADHTKICGGEKYLHTVHGTLNDVGHYAYILRIVRLRLELLHTLFVWSVYFLRYIITSSVFLVVSCGVYSHFRCHYLKTSHRQRTVFRSFRHTCSAARSIDSHLETHA